MKAVIVDYGMGNLQSVKNACGFLGFPTVVARDEKSLREASHLILPGVGAFRQGMENLNERELVGLLRDLVLQKKKPLLGICLGMQLLAESGTEGGECEGLGFIRGRVARLAGNGLRVPHIGWNEALVRKANAFIKKQADFYFVHSYHFDVFEPGDVIAETEYGETFVSAVGRENIFGAQFHPEKSHGAGLELLRNFLVS